MATQSARDTSLQAPRIKPQDNILATAVKSVIQEVTIQKRVNRNRKISYFKQIGKREELVDVAISQIR